MPSRAFSWQDAVESLVRVFARRFLDSRFSGIVFPFEVPIQHKRRQQLSRAEYRRHAPSHKAHSMRRHPEQYASREAGRTTPPNPSPAAGKARSEQTQTEQYRPQTGQ